MHTLVLSPRHTPDSQALWRAAIAAGWDTVRVPGYQPPPELFGRARLAFYAETLLADAIAPPLGWVLLEPDLAWLPDLPFPYRKREVRASRLGDERRVGARQFLKPADDKAFAARVYEIGEHIDPEHAIADALPVLVAEPVRFTLEVRAFVIDRAIATLSSYVREGVLACTADDTWPLDDDDRRAATHLLEGLLGDAEVALPPALVIDVGHIDGGGWAVIEANAAWAAGICGCDPAQVLAAVARTCVRRSSLDPALGRWARTPSLAIE